jgi:hypothetical protein
MTDPDDLVVLVTLHDTLDSGEKLICIIKDRGPGGIDQASVIAKSPDAGICATVVFCDIGWKQVSKPYRSCIRMSPSPRWTTSQAMDEKYAGQSKRSAKTNGTS